MVLSGCGTTKAKRRRGIVTSSRLLKRSKLLECFCTREWNRIMRGEDKWSGGIVTLPCEERERTTPQRFSSGRDDLAPRAHRRGA